MSNPTPPPPATISFARGVIARLTLWPALRIAVQNGWGGPDSDKKRTWIASVIVDAFEELPSPPDAGYIEELLLQIMEDEFETVIEDESAGSVAKDVTKLWTDIHLGDLASLHHLEQQADIMCNKPVVATPGPSEEDSTDNDEEDDDEGSDDEVGYGSDPPPDLQLPMTDGDGFMTVNGRYYKHR